MDSLDSDYATTAQAAHTKLRTACRAVNASELLQNATDLHGKIILVTGAASGIGLAFTRMATSLGATVVLGDINIEATTRISEEINNHFDQDEGGKCVTGPKLNVTSWKDQLDMFEFIDKKFRRLDVVVACAGITEKPGLEMDSFGADGLLEEPSLITMDINLKGTIYTLKLARYYMRKRDVKGHIVLLGSLSSFFGLPMGPTYTVSKHGVLGLMRSCYYTAKYSEGISLNLVAPWYTDTPILETPVRLLLAGLPLAKMANVVQAIVYAATSPEAAGVALPVDPSGVLCLSHEATDFRSEEEDAFHVMYSKRSIHLISRIATIRDVLKALARPIGATALFSGLMAVVALVSWRVLR